MESMLVLQFLDHMRHPEINGLSEDLNMKFHYFLCVNFGFFILQKHLIAWPGGFGTLDELMEVLTLIQNKKNKNSITYCSLWKRILGKCGELGLYG